MSAIAATPERVAPDPADTELSREDLRRYSRHLLLPEVGEAGQRRLKAARVLCVGTGGLGSPLLLYLAAAGVGTIGIVDADTVESSNLQRQIIHGTSTIGQRKVASAVARIHDLNPSVTVEVHDTWLTSANALALVEQYDVVVDGTDNFPTRYLVNDACVLLGKPNIYGSIYRFDGQVSVFWAERGPCYRCLFREPPPPGLVPSCAEGGVLGVLPGIIGSLQALETIKVLLGIGDPMIGRMALFDGLELRWREVTIKKDPSCQICGAHPTITAPIDYQAFCGVAEPSGEELPSLTAVECAASLAAGTPLFILDVREPHEWMVSNLLEFGARHIPLAQLGGALHNVPTDQPIVVHCRAGARSAKAVRLLRDAGFGDVRNLEGGLLAWRDTVNPSLEVA
jgi:sulfur-carrier protein adenylyltransferase/sulfurtransferase